MVQWTNCFDVVPSGSSFKGIRESITAILGMRTLTGVGLGGGGGGGEVASFKICLQACLLSLLWENSI